jgi:processive 1,2-diacylglycerol beta-glucosyltransferase
VPSKPALSKPRRSRRERVTKRLLILTAGFGEGHHAAARASAAAWDERHGAGSAVVVDLLARASPRVIRILCPAYLSLINRFPAAWSFAYGAIDRSTWLTAGLRLLRAERQVLHDLIRELQPVALCSTYPVYGCMVRALARAGTPVPPHFIVVTDSISINSLWWRWGGDGWFVPNDDSAQVLRAAGLPYARIHVSGFPVAPAFAALAGGAARLPLGAAGTVPGVLHLVHSGVRGAAAIAHELLQHPTWRVTCAVGRDERLQRELLPVAARRKAPTEILGWTNRIPELLSSHHVVVSKAGGATTQEALAARCPMIVNQIVPGQEQGNYELLRRHRIGSFAPTPAAVVATLERAFGDGGRIWHDWHTATATLSRPSAAAALVEQIGRLAARSGSQVGSHPA